jgi:hypothetical protein
VLPVLTSDSISLLVVQWHHGLEAVNDLTFDSTVLVCVEIETRVLIHHSILKPGIDLKQQDFAGMIAAAESGYAHLTAAVLADRKLFAEAGRGYTFLPMVAPPPLDDPPQLQLAVVPDDDPGKMDMEHNKALSSLLSKGKKKKKKRPVVVAEK